MQCVWHAMAGGVMTANEMQTCPAPASELMACVTGICHTALPGTNLYTGTLPNNGEAFMGIKFLPNGTTEVRHYYRTPQGVSTHKARTVPGHSKTAAIKVKAALIEEVEKELRSLKDPQKKEPDWGDLCDVAFKIKNGSGMPWVYNLVKKGLAGKVDEKFPARYERYIMRMELEEKSVNTISNHKSVIRRILNVAYQSGRIDVIPIRKFNIEQKFRQRVWQSEEERLRLFNTMIKERSHLYWAVVLLERRPIRAVSDLFRLTDGNLVRINGLPVLSFLAKKTGKNEKNTFIPLYDKQGNVFDDVMNYLHRIRPRDCPLLFPRIFDDGRWEPMGNPKKHWNTMVRKAKITDLHIHDLKHVATTNMIEEGWSIEALMAMGCQFSEKMIRKVYWQQKAEKFLRIDTDSKEKECVAK
jgi:integrase